ncbi:MAG: MFS transporter [Anaerolineales bacterium]|nr:MFS transporter [Anaerolineales bacterium]
MPVIRSFGATTPIPPEYRRNFHHLTADVAWFGLLAGTTIAFLGVYAAHIGATAFQIGLLTAGPALVNLIFTMPAGRWLHNRPIGPAVFGAAVASRLLFLVYALVPLLLPDPAQIHVMIIATLIFALPGVVLAIGFNALFAAAVPPEWRGVVAGRRNAMLSLVYVVASLLAGVILNNTSQAVGYTLVFGLGFVGAVMSTYHLGRLRNVVEKPSSEPERLRQVIGDTAQPGDTRGGQGVGGRVGVGLRAFTRGQNLLRTEVLRGGFGWVILSLFAFHTAQYMPAALFPLQWVDVLHFSDGQIAMATAVFHISTFVGSVNLGRLTRRFGNHKLTVAGTSLLSLYPLLTALMPNFFWFLVTSIVGGQGWALVGGALGNYLLDKVPAGDRPAYLAWYNLALNAAILLGALLGPLLAGWFDIRIALILAFVARLAASAFIYFVEPKARTEAPAG